MKNNIELIVPLLAVASVEEEIAKINKRASRIGCDPVRYSVGDPFTIEAKNARGITVERTIVRINVTVAMPIRIGGYQFVAVKEIVNGALMLFTAPSFEGQIPDELRNETMSCAHCNTRRDRNTVIILRDGDRFISVGSTCVKDYTGYDVESLLAYRGMWADVQDIAERDSDEFGRLMGHSSADYDAIPIVSFMASAARIVETHGYVSRRRANDEFSGVIATADRLGSLYFPSPTDEQQHRDAAAFFASITDDDRARAEHIVEFIRSTTDGSDYAFNMRSIFKGSSVVSRQFGFAASGVAMYDRAHAAPLSGSGPHVGTIKGRETFTVVHESSRVIDGHFGPKVLMRFRTPENSLLVWFASSGIDERMESRLPFKIKATVKEHGEFNGEKQTVISRAVIA